MNKTKRKKMLLCQLLLWNEKRIQKKSTSRYYGKFFEDFLIHVIEKNDDKILRRKLRLNCKAFNHLLHLLTESTQFKTWKSRNLQNQTFVTISKQLCIYLYFISRNMSYDSLADLFGVGSTGTISTIIKRVADAILEFKNIYIRWHSDSSKADMLSTAASYGFDGCIALADGVVNDITSFEKVFTASWTTRKQKYGIVSLVLCDLQDRILFYSSGNCGSRNDSGIWKDDIFPNIDNLTDSIMY